MYKLKLKNDQRGLAHVGVVALVIVVVAAIGFVGWRVSQKDSANLSDAGKEILAQCDLEDKDLCKFFANSASSTKYSIASTDTRDGVTTKSIIKLDGDKSYFKTEGEIAYEVITIGDVTYTKSGEVWYKQTAKKPDDKPVDNDEFKYEEPKDEQPEAEQTKYEKQGKEDCGDLQCFKYKVIDPGDSDNVQYIWFDDKDYLTRKSRTEGKDGSVSEQVFEYDNVSVSEPSPVKELAENQYIVPGQSEPATLPDNSDLEALQQSYSQ